MNNISGQTKIDPVMDAFASEDEGPVGTTIQVPTESWVVGTAWVREGRGGAQLARQTLEIEPEIEGMEVVL